MSALPPRRRSILYTIDTAKSEIALSSVRSFGTEDRKKDGPAIAATSDVYPYIIFQGSDIKDLQVIEQKPQEKKELPAPTPAPAPAPAPVPGTAPVAPPGVPYGGAFAAPPAYGAPPPYGGYPGPAAAAAWGAYSAPAPPLNAEGGYRHMKMCGQPKYY